MSYGALVHEQINERLRSEFGTADRKRCALKFASDNFADYPERRVYEVLLELNWPARRVTVSEVQRGLRRVPEPERKAWRFARVDEVMPA